MNTSQLMPTPVENVPMTMSDRLEREESQLIARLKKVQEIRKTLSENPNIQKVIDGLTEIGQYHY